MAEVSTSQEQNKEVFQSATLDSLTKITADNNNSVSLVMPCLFCDETFPKTENASGNPILAHLLYAHKLVIANVQKILNFPGYIGYWKKEFSAVDDWKVLCVQIKTNTSPDDKAPSEDYYMLNEFMPEDKALREELIIRKLETLLEVQQKERNDINFFKTCLFCKETFRGNRANIFKHMAQDHSFNVGNSDNIVYASEFLDLIKNKLESFTCLCCGKQFKEWNILKDHMRKKGHKRIDPKNKEYDKFYLINYLQPGKDWKEVQMEPEYEKENLEDEEDDPTKEWEEWKEEKGMLSLCLFCAKTERDANLIISHMKEDHEFDIQVLKRKLKLNFYQQVKIINYIRKKVYELTCPKCLVRFKNRGEVELHLSAKRHCDVHEDKLVWDQPCYFFPTFEDDILLCYLQDDGDKGNESKNFVST